MKFWIFLFSSHLDQPSGLLYSKNLEMNTWTSLANKLYFFFRIKSSILPFFRCYTFGLSAWSLSVLISFLLHFILCFESSLFRLLFLYFFVFSSSFVFLPSLHLRGIIQSEVLCRSNGRCSKNNPNRSKKIWTDVVVVDVVACGFTKRIESRASHRTWTTRLCEVASVKLTISFVHNQPRHQEGAQANRWGWTIIDLATPTPTWTRLDRTHKSVVMML